MYKLLSLFLFAYGLAVTIEDIYDNSWALVIGIDKYQNVSNLSYAVKDAESINEILVNSFAFLHWFWLNGGFAIIKSAFKSSC